MYYGEEKALEMSRSLLPCNKRKSARKEKSRVARRLRRNVKQKLHNIREEDDYYDSQLDYDYYEDAAIERSEMVWNRRSRDKLGPFMSWAEAKAKEIPDGEKYHYIKSLLPGSGFIIQDHAMSHLEWLDGFHQNPIERYYYRRPVVEKLSDEEMAEYLKEIVIDSKAHRLLNDAIKRFHHNVTWYYKYREFDPELEKMKTHSGQITHKVSPRVLKGLGDIESFMRDLKLACNVPNIKVKNGESTLNKKYRKLIGRDTIQWSSQAGTLYYASARNLISPHRHPEWRKALNNFIKVWRKLDYIDYEKLRNVKVKANPYSYGYNRYTYNRGLIW